MDNSLKGILIHTNIFGWQVRYEFGENQVRNLHIHHSCIENVKEKGIEGEEVEFVIRGTPAPSTLNGAIPSALLINKD